MVESPKAPTQIVRQRNSNPIQQAELDVKEPNSKKIIAIGVPSSSGEQPIKDQNKKTKTFQENQLWNLIVYNLPTVLQRQKKSE